MNAQLNTSPALAQEPAQDVAFTSVTIWTDGEYFLQVHYGFFNSWEEAEDFATVGDLSLRIRSNALFLIGPHGAAFLPDQSLQIYRSFGVAVGSTFDMRLDDLLEIADMDDMTLQAIGSRPVQRGKPLIAQAMSSFEFQAVNDADAL